MYHRVNGHLRVLMIAFEYRHMSLLQLDLPLILMHNLLISMDPPGPFIHSLFISMITPPLLQPIVVIIIAVVAVVVVVVHHHLVEVKQYSIHHQCQRQPATTPRLLHHLQLIIIMCVSHQ
jgi:hypothetical protein